MPTAEQVYADHARPLPYAERLRLAALILEELTNAPAAPAPPEAVPASASHRSGPWSREELRGGREARDSAFQFRPATTLLPEEGAE
jgi:hypothetical protein